MSETMGPAVARERLRSRLRQLRDEAGRSAPDVDQAMDWPASTLEAIEGGAETIHPVQVEDLLTLYGRSDPGVITDLTSLAAVARTAGWWDRHALSGEHQQFIGQEAEAARISVYQPLVVPGLLQTADYALAATASILGKPEDDPDVVARVEIRRERQRLLERRVAAGSAPALIAILEEVVLLRPVGGAPVLHGQLEYLLAQAQRDHVTLVIMPTGIGGHVGLGGVFELLEFHDPRVRAMVFIESTATDYIARGPEAATLYRNNVERLRQLGRNDRDALETVRSARDSLSG